MLLSTARRLAAQPLGAALSAAASLCSLPELVASSQQRHSSLSNLSSSLNAAQAARWSSQQAGGGSDGSGSRSGSSQPADVLRWLGQEFGLKEEQLTAAGSKAAPLLEVKQETLEGNWKALQGAFEPTPTAKSKLAYALQGGQIAFLLLKSDTVKEKVAALQGLLGVSDEHVSAKLGSLAVLLDHDIDSLRPRFSLLLELTGMPSDKLAAHILRQPTLLSYTEEALQRNYASVVAAVGDEGTAQLLVSGFPDVLEGAEDKVPRNLQALQQLGASPEAALRVLVSNGRLAGQDLEQPKFAARVAFWQQAYGIKSTEAAVLKCADMLHRDLRTVAPRVAFWRSQRPGKPLPRCHTFTVADETFCRKQHLRLTGFLAFKQQWAASPEGQELCQHEREGTA